MGSSSGWDRQTRIGAAHTSAMCDSGGGPFKPGFGLSGLDEAGLNHAGDWSTLILLNRFF